MLGRGPERSHGRAARPYGSKRRGNRSGVDGVNTDMPAESPRTRNEAEFREFVAECSPRLLRAAYLLLRDAEAAQDAVQTTLLRTFRRWRRAREAPEPYSRRVLINVCHDQWRSQERHPETSLAVESAADLPVVSESGCVEDRLMLDALLGELPVRQRAALVLRFYLDLSVAETAALLDVPEGTVKSATHRGLDRLRELLDSRPQEVLKKC
jgi:RNA polymerase sigma-70 factor (sigma-E family)